jgi:hypothetical protein
VATRWDSTRPETITADLRARARAFAGRYSHAPSQRELARLAQASNFATRDHIADGELAPPLAELVDLHAQFGRRLKSMPADWGAESGWLGPRHLLTTTAAMSVLASGDPACRSGCRWS